MPIYAYRCESCGHAQDVLQKISDPLLTVCPVCGQETYKKQVTAAGFQLKGSGWYVTDFRNKAAAPPPAGAAAPGLKSEADGSSGSSKSDAPAATGSGDSKPAGASESSSSPSSKPETKSDAPKSKPSGTSGPSGSSSTPP